MADRISQLQGKVDQQSENFCNAVGVLDQTAPASKLSDPRNPAEESPSGNPEDDPQGGSGSNAVVKMLAACQWLVGCLVGSPRRYFQFRDYYPVTFSQLIINTARNINTLVESLPMINSEVSHEELQKLESDNQEEAKRVEAELKRAEEMLPEIQAALADIAEVQIQCQETESLILNATY